MKKFLSPLLFTFTGTALLLSACSNTPVDHTKTAECSHVTGKIIASPAVQRNPGEQFLNQYQKNQDADYYRQQAKRTGCLQ